MSNEAVKWAMDDAPMLRTDKGKPDTTARHVLQALAEHAHKDGSNAHPSLLRIQYRTGYDRRTVQRAQRRLEDAGLISANGAVRGCTRWKLHLEKRRPTPTGLHWSPRRRPSGRRQLSGSGSRAPGASRTPTT
ncbi:helix-turn-helix domain-containing protein [Streptomyces eurocidicus]|uniref:DNA-binding protein n=1 Tax=Streptomyces eurocidicus TaxID=66423 RepID=A0A7W8BBC0_STREU|nr:helix-turn-helix domain-containing protein [Streptomyces eurocidicus]MBB5118708.1 hypothetical protein [Streptomyces eurocidicus]MBF6051477.1 hypothetical protein [Streptomyces eurocidicus]